ncbi:MAG: prolyl oligopeptidase family serine peptidase [Acidobacteria bacterium]|nr:prolyl oligopeptidase family serine peptidase [Acidobacteriota bacterium]
MKIKRLVASLYVVAFAAAALIYFVGVHRAEAQQSGFTIEQVLSSPFPSELIAAPTGERIAWVFDAEGKRNIWVADGPEFKARQLTQFNEDTGQELTELQFTHDGEWIVFVRGGSANSAGEIPNPTSDPAGASEAIHAVSVKDGRVIRLAEGASPVVSPTDKRVVFSKDRQIHIVEIVDGSEPHQLFVARGLNITPQWSPDGKQLAFNSSRSDHSFIAIYDFEKQTIRYIAPSVDRDSAPRWSLDGKKIAFIRQPARGNAPRTMMQDAPDPWAIWVADAASSNLSGSAKEIWHSGNQPQDSPPRMAGENLLQWAADNRLVFASEMDGWMRLYSIAASGGEVKALTPASCEWESMSLTPDKRTIVYSSNCGDIDRRHLTVASVSQASVQTISTKGGGIEWSPVVTGTGKRLAYFSSSASSPGQLVVITPSQGVEKITGKETASELQLKLPISFPKEFPENKLVTPQQVIFKAADGQEIHGQLFLPKDAKPTDKLPAVIFSHGGPMRQMMLGWHNMYYYHNAYGFNQFLASRGYAVLSVNYRLGIGYGRAFRQAKNGGGRGASEYQDILAGAMYLRSRADIDPARIGLWGGSYGGYLTALGLARNSDLFAAGVDLHGVHDWSVRLSNATWIEYGNRDAVKIALESSPVASVEKWRSPVLFIHGDDDRNVAFSQTVDLVRRLRELKVPHEVIVFPDEIHDFLLHRTWVQIYKAAFDFFERNLKTAKPKTAKVDTLIRGGSVIDGSGSAATKADVGITGDRITFVGDASVAGIEAERVIDATGLIVSPGFIDPHTHADEDIFNPQRNANLAFLTQGVTTVFIGSDGRSKIPLGQALRQLDAQKIGTNVASFVGQGAVRSAVMGMSDAAPTAEQLAKMKALVRQGMEEGAIGLSTGLYYAPGSYSKTEEVIELAKVAAQFGGVYDTHQRDESSYTIGLLGSIAEVLRIGREAHIPVHISHIKALGADVWGQSTQAIEMINRARAEGINATANQYPYIASGTGLGASLLPRWAEAGGRAEFLKRVDDPTIRPKLIAEMEQNLKRRGGANTLLLHSNDRTLNNKRLDEIAKARGKSPVETALDILKVTSPGATSFNMIESDIENFMKQPWVMTGSDGSGGHPRKWGNYPRKIREYVINRKVISMERMIQASSAQVAETFHLKDRGKLAAGNFADVIVFDPKTITDRSTYEQPELQAEGLRYIWVNGKLELEGGKYNGVLAGRTLRRPISGE